MRITELQAQPNRVLSIVADNGRIGRFDASPYLQYEAFEALRDQNEFVKVTMAGILSNGIAAPTCQRTLLRHGGRLLERQPDREPPNKSPVRPITLPSFNDISFGFDANAELDITNPKWKAVIAKNHALACELGIWGTPASSWATNWCRVVGFEWAKGAHCPGGQGKLQSLNSQVPAGDMKMCDTGWKPAINCL